MREGGIPQNAVARETAVTAKKPLRKLLENGRLTHTICWMSLLQALIEQCIGFSPADRQAAKHIETELAWVMKTYNGLVDAVLRDARLRRGAAEDGEPMIRSVVSFAWAAHTARGHPRLLHGGLSAGAAPLLQHPSGPGLRCKCGIYATSGVSTLLENIVARVKSWAAGACAVPPLRMAPAGAAALRALRAATGGGAAAGAACATGRRRRRRALRARVTDSEGHRGHRPVNPTACRRRGVASAGCLHRGAPGAATISATAPASATAGWPGGQSSLL